MGHKDPSSLTLRDLKGVCSTLIPRGARGLALLTHSASFIGSFSSLSYFRMILLVFSRHFSNKSRGLLLENFAKTARMFSLSLPFSPATLSCLCQKPPLPCPLRLSLKQQMPASGPRLCACGSYTLSWEPQNFSRPNRNPYEVSLLSSCKLGARSCPQPV